ncbi:MAG: hypothetical protein KDA88_00410 [Planctomycetaceae bacterium]|nr:hypothetical protein [Planctomycetaceae bacterium]MCB9950316.1 hypothetical protein [Planctomycetaceae bacterium]
MILSTIRSIGAIVLSLIVAMVLIIAVEGFSAVVHPFPPGVDPTDMEACKAHVANYPGWVLAVIVPMWAATVFLSCWIATRLGASRHSAHGIGLGVLLYAAVTFNMIMLPYPFWFEAANYVLFPLSIFVGVKLGVDQHKTTSADA